MHDKIRYSAGLIDRAERQLVRQRALVKQMHLTDGLSYATPAHDLIKTLEANIATLRAQHQTMLNSSAS